MTSTKRKTATIDRYHCYGTPNHHLSVSYRSKVLRWSTHDKDGYWTGNAYADMVDYGKESIDAAKRHAINHGFTHVKFTGEWPKGGKPKGGKISTVKGVTE